MPSNRGLNIDATPESLDDESTGQGRRDEAYWMASLLRGVVVLSPIALAMYRDSAYAVCWVVAVAGLAVAAQLRR